MSADNEHITLDIESYLKEHENKDMLRFLTCGSVDDGKSTLIGRLLYDSKAIFEDQLNAVQSESQMYGTTGEKIDLALLVDGLQSEREQGITIDVAYRFFTTENRKFIIADTPGHEQYTRNMATGASNADLAVILIDARNGVLTQTRRHSFIVTLMGIRELVITVNKMDLVDYSEDIFNKIDSVFPREEIEPNYKGETAQRFRYKDGTGEVGIIASVSKPFCGDCTRIRLSNDGKVYTCLFSGKGHDLREIVRDTNDIEAVKEGITKIWQNRTDKYSEQRAMLTETNSIKPKIEMYRMGG
ncbi:MAG: GTP-binding protein [Campylobacteraceae bacterium]|nr:GTP-binding protein [Campylobacteraceae bacterium]